MQCDTLFPSSYVLLVSLDAGLDDYWWSEDSLFKFNSSQRQDCITITLMEDDLVEYAEAMHLVLSSERERILYKQDMAEVFIQDSNSKNSCEEYLVLCR